MSHTVCRTQPYPAYMLRRIQTHPHTMPCRSQTYPAHNAMPHPTVSHTQWYAVYRLCCIHGLSTCSSMLHTFQCLVLLYVVHCIMRHTLLCRTLYRNQLYPVHILHRTNFISHTIYLAQYVAYTPNCYPAHSLALGEHTKLKFPGKF